ncbi:MAG TPA: hypothetical protein VMK42_14055 [Anaeromyxobacteraceae bacterium]|nr:hypothetical protein [Anaeromyxobacteraceae bacterium]
MATSVFGVNGLPQPEPLGPQAKGNAASAGDPDARGKGEGGAPRHRSSATPASGVSDISDLAGAVYRLEQLHRDQPDRFAAVMRRVASRLEEGMESLGDAHARFVGELAHRFREAARTLTLPALLAPQKSASSGPGAPPQRVRSYATQQAAAEGDALQRSWVDLARVLGDALDEIAG